LATGKIIKRRPSEVLRDEVVAASNPVTPTSKSATDIDAGDWPDPQVQQQSTSTPQRKISPSRRNASRVAAELAFA
jgi:hypothetical protein